MRIIVGALVLVAAVAVPPVQAAFLGNLHSGDVLVEVDTGAAGDIALTGVEVKKTKLAVFAIATVPAGQVQQLTRSISKNTQRLVLAADTTPGGFYTIRVVQGAASFIQDLTADHTELVFNVTP